MLILISFYSFRLSKRLFMACKLCLYTWLLQNTTPPPPRKLDKNNVILSVNLKNG